MQCILPDELVYCTSLVTAAKAALPKPGSSVALFGMTKPSWTAACAARSFCPWCCAPRSGGESCAAGAKNMASRGGSATGGMHGSGHSASEPSMHQDSSHAAWTDAAHSEGGWEDGGQRGAAVQGRSASDSAQQQGQLQNDDDDSWAVRETAPASRSAADAGKAPGNFAGFEGAGQPCGVQDVCLMQVIISSKCDFEEFSEAWRLRMQEWGSKLTVVRGPV